MSEVQRFVKEQKIKDPQIKRQLLEDARGKSKRQFEKHLAAIAPKPVPKEKEIILTQSETEVRIVLNERVMQKLKRIRDKWSHKNTNYSYAELIEAMADEVLKETPPAQAIKPVKKTKAIPAAIKREVWRRDEGKCQWKGCASRLSCPNRSSRGKDLCWNPRNRKLETTLRRPQPIPRSVSVSATVTASGNWAP